MGVLFFAPGPQDLCFCELRVGDYLADTAGSVSNIFIAIGVRLMDGGGCWIYIGFWMRIGMESRDDDWHVDR
jgi:hypothetical protein